MTVDKNAHGFHVVGRKGRETFLLTENHRLVAAGALRDLIAMSNPKTKARQRVIDVEQKNPMGQASARVRKLNFELDLTTQ